MKEKCKRLAILYCSRCKKNVCFDHAVDICELCCHGKCGKDYRHVLDGVTATCCTVEVER